MKANRTRSLKQRIREALVGAPVPKMLLEQQGSVGRPSFQFRSVSPDQG